MKDYRQTILAQYANSPILTGLVGVFDQEIRPDADIDNFFNLVWNLPTAQGFGLDILGRIVNVTRNITIPGVTEDFGFKEALPGSYGFGQAPFYPGASASSVYTLSDAAFRVLILTKAAINISNTTCQSINALMQILFAGRGACYVVDNLNMSLTYTFDFPLSAWELAIVSGDFLPRPTGVLATVNVTHAVTTFGFGEGGYGPFGYGNFYTA